MATITNDKIDEFLLNYLKGKTNVSSSHIYHFNRQLGIKQAKIIGRLKALNNKGLLKIMKKPRIMEDDSIMWINLYTLVD